MATTDDTARKALADQADQNIISFTLEQWDEFQRRLDEPPQFIPALHKLFSEPEPFSLGAQYTQQIPLK